jgi:hypothetical protein
MSALGRNVTLLALMTGIAASTISMVAVAIESDQKVWDCDKGWHAAASTKRKLDRNEVTKVAGEEAKRRGVDLTQFELLSVCFRSEKEGSWTVFFHGLVPAPGNHFSVVVNDRDRTARLRGGE